MSKDGINIDIDIDPTPTPVPPAPLPPNPTPPAPPGPPAPPIPAPNQATVEKALSILLKLVDGAALLTGNAVVKAIAGVLDKFLTQPWFINLLMEVIGLIFRGASTTEIEKCFAKYGQK